MKSMFAAIMATALLIPSVSYAQNSSGDVGGALGGAAVGGVVAGPPGAIIGAGVGAIMGSTLPPQPSVVYDQSVVVGEALPDDFTHYAVPNEDSYSYVIINNRKVIVDRRTRRIVRVIE